MVFDSWKRRARGFSSKESKLARERGFFVVDMDISGCYKARKDKLFGGESPNELQKQSRVRPQTCLAGQAC